MNSPCRLRQVYGWGAEPRTTARPPCSVNHPGHHAGARATRVNHNRAHAAHATATIKERVMRMRDPRSGGAHGLDGRHSAWRSGALGPHAHGSAVTQVVDDRRAEVRGPQKQSNDPRSNPHNPRYANHWAPLTRTRPPPQPAQPQHTNHWAPRTRKQHKPPALFLPLRARQDSSRTRTAHQTHWGFVKPPAQALHKLTNSKGASVMLCAWGGGVPVERRTYDSQ